MLDLLRHEVGVTQVGPEVFSVEGISDDRALMHLDSLARNVGAGKIEASEE